MFGGSTPYLRPGEWQVTTIYRRAVSDLHYQGTKPYPELDPFGPVNTQNLLFVDLSRGLTRKLSLTMGVPLVWNSFAVRRAAPGTTDLQWLTTRASGLGDMTLRANYWLFRTREGDRWNVAVSAGLKAPTGAAGATGTVYGREVPVDISIQPGDKAWAGVGSVQGYWNLEWFTLFGSAGYMANPRNTTRVGQFFPLLTNPRSTAVNSSTDQYVWQAGASFRTRDKWPVPLLAYRLSGVPVNDLFGASDGFRRPGVVGMIEPGISYTWKKSTFTLTVPVTVYVNVKDNPRSPRIEDATVPGYAWQLTWFRRFGR